MTNRDHTDESTQDEDAPPTPSAPIVSIETLLRGGKEVLIRNGDDVYRLIRTRNGKLLLNKFE